MDYVTSIYEITRDFPDSERFGLASQLQRAAVSVSSNIAEGSGRYFKKEFVHFLYQARGSLLETFAQIEIAFRLGYITDQVRDQLIETGEEISKMLNGLIKSLKD